MRCLTLNFTLNIWHCPLFQAEFVLYFLYDVYGFSLTPIFCWLTDWYYNGRVYYYYYYYYSIWMSLVTGLFFLVLLLNQRWSQPLRLQVSHCSTFRITCDVPSIAVICSESIECLPGTASNFFFRLLVTIPVAPITIIIIIIIIIMLLWHIFCLLLC